MDFANQTLESLIDRLIYFKEEKTILSIDKYSTNWILAQIGESDEIRMMELKFKEYDAKGVDIIDFVRIILSVIEHEENQTLYIVIGAIDLFKEICESFNLSNLITCGDVVNYIVEVIYHHFLYNKHFQDIFATQRAF